MQAHITQELLTYFDDLTEEDVSQAQFHFGITYLERHYGKELAVEMSKERLFWSWWDRIFTTVNEQVISGLAAQNLRFVLPKDFYHRLVRPKLRIYTMTDKIKGEIFNNIKIDTLCQTA